jgi:ABC-type lipoprotein release transport system permease subunit
MSTGVTYGILGLLLGCFFGAVLLCVSVENAKEYIRNEIRSSVKTACLVEYQEPFSFNM